jgi:hypothetical protein
VRFAATGLSILGLAGSGLASEPMVTNTSRFRIPFTVDSTSMDPNSSYAVLFASKDNGPMEQMQRVAVASRSFEFSAPDDGLYSFAVRMTDANGSPYSQSPVVPELSVLVDTQPPQLHLDVVDAGNGQATIRWESRDRQIAPGSLQIQYAEGTNGRWKDLRVPAASDSGQISVSSHPGTAISVKASIVDTAGNEGTAQTQQILSAQTALPADTLTPQATTPQHSAPQHSTLSIPGNSSPSAINSTPWSVPTLPKTSQVQNKNPFAPVNTIGSTNIQPLSSPGTQDINPVSQTSAPTTTGSQQLVNSPLFDIAYQIDDLGPSGIGSVDLYVTEDNGQHWFRYGSDQDLQSPFQVDVQGEGTFGFVIRVRNGLGFSAAPPQPGELPEIVVVVDQTAPQIQFPEPQVQTLEQGFVHLSWSVQEPANQAVMVRLEQSTSPSGQWTPVFDWRRDPGQFQWPIRPGVPQSVYFRILAKDSAGNIGTAQTPRPVLIDQKRPTARVLRVQPVTQSRIGF